MFENIDLSEQLDLSNEYHDLYEFESMFDDKKINEAIDPISFLAGVFLAKFGVTILVVGIVLGVTAVSALLLLIVKMVEVTIKIYKNATMSIKLKLKKMFVRNKEMKGKINDAIEKLDEETKRLKETKKSLQEQIDRKGEEAKAEIAKKKSNISSEEYKKLEAENADKVEKMKKDLAAAGDQLLNARNNKEKTQDVLDNKTK